MGSQGPLSQEPVKYAAKSGISVRVCWLSRFCVGGTACSPWDIGKRLCQLSQTLKDWPGRHRDLCKTTTGRQGSSAPATSRHPLEAGLPDLQPSLRYCPFSPALSLFYSLKDICVIPYFDSLHKELQHPQRPRQHFSFFPYNEGTGFESSKALGPSVSAFSPCAVAASMCLRPSLSKTLSIRVLKPAGSSIRPPTQETAPHTNCHLSLPSCSQTLTSTSDRSASWKSRCCYKVSRNCQEDHLGSLEF